MSPLFARRAVLWVTLSVGAFGGCGDGCCTDTALIGPGGNKTCNPLEEQAKCEDGDAFRFDACGASGCGSDADCCPGSRCRADLNSCFPLLLDADYACDVSDDCPDPAQRCIATRIGAREPLNTCVYERCGSSSDCGFGRTCFENHCFQTVPCGGACPDGTACDVISGQCTTVPDTKSCNKDCGSKLRVIKDPDTMSGEVCCDVECACAGLPPIVPTRFGRYSRVAVNTEEVLVSAYDAEYGDLVVAHYGLDGAQKSLEYIDGVPAGGTVIADPDGPRGGIGDHGANVGTHTSIALSSTGDPRVAYRDEDAQSLKVALRADGKWQSHVVDPGEAGGSVGQFTDITVAAGGTIWVSYLAHNVNVPGLAHKGTALKVAKSRSPVPATPSDWDLFFVDAREMFDACNFTCTGATTCVISGGAPQCAANSTNCVDQCKATQACVTTAAGDECAPLPLPPESADVPRGRGLYTSIVLDGTEPVVAYYDSIDGDLRAARVTATGTATTFVVDGDGQGTHRSGDVGKFPAVTRSGGQLLIAYEDFGHHELRVWQGNSPGLDGTYTTVDAGTQQSRSGKLFVGAGARVAHNTTTPVVVFQDASNLDLKIASPLDAIWVATPMLTTGAHGFYSDIAVANGTAYVVSVLAELDGRGQERSRLGLTVQPAP